MAACFASSRCTRRGGPRELSAPTGKPDVHSQRGDHAVAVDGIGIGQALGLLADYLAAAALLSLGAFLLFGGDDEVDTTAMLKGGRGLAVVGLGVSISLDELSIASASTSHLPLL